MLKSIADREARRFIRLGSGIKNFTEGAEKYSEHLYKKTAAIHATAFVQYHEKAGFKPVKHTPVGCGIKFIHPMTLAQVHLSQYKTSFQRPSSDYEYQSLGRRQPPLTCNNDGAAAILCAYLCQTRRSWHIKWRIRSPQVLLTAASPPLPRDCRSVLSRDSGAEEKTKM